jgi:hypothetical protein
VVAGTKRKQRLPGSKNQLVSCEVWIRYCKSSCASIAARQVEFLLPRSRFALNVDGISALPAACLPRHFILRLRHSHQPMIEPADDVLEPLDAMPGLA